MVPFQNWTGAAVDVLFEFNCNSNGHVRRRFRKVGGKQYGSRVFSGTFVDVHKADLWCRPVFV